MTLSTASCVTFSGTYFSVGEGHITRSPYSSQGPSRALPNNVGVPPIPYLGAAYLGPAHEPFAVHGDPNDPLFAVPNIGLKDREHRARLQGRMRLRQRLDDLTRQAEQLGKRGAFDAFHAQAWNLLTGPQARRAFDLGLESDRVRERYGRNTWGQRC